MTFEYAKNNLSISANCLTKSPAPKIHFAIINI